MIALHLFIFAAFVTACSSEGSAQLISDGAPTKPANRRVAAVNPLPHTRVRAREAAAALLIRDVASGKPSDRRVASMNPLRYVGHARARRTPTSLLIHDAVSFEPAGRRVASMNPIRYAGHARARRTPTSLLIHDAVSLEPSDRRVASMNPIRYARHARTRRAPACDPSLVEPLVIFPHQRVEIACSKCSPRSPSSASWRYQAYSATHDDQITKKTMSRMDIEITDDNVLIIDKATVDNAGRYYCKNGATYLGNYDVTYVSHPMFHITLPNDPEYQPLQESRSNETNEITMYTEWGSWSSCNHCGQPGERVKIGLCYARTRLHDFPAGVPCRSNLVPYSERPKYQYDQRVDEKMIAACQVPCPPKPKETSTGQLVRTFALSQGIPTLPNLVKRRVYYVNAGDNAQLVCPEVGVTHGVRWTNGSSTMSQLDLMQAGTRFRIDDVNRLCVDNVRFGDAGNFTCWFENEKIAIVILKVTKAPQISEEAEGNAMYVGMVLVFLMVFYILFGVFRNRSLQTIQ